MPCRWSRRCGSSVKDATVTNEEGVEMQTWHSVRRENLRRLRKNTRHIVLLMAMIEAIRAGPVQMVYAGKQGYAPRGPEDFGIAYNVGYFISWLYVCLFMAVYIPLFSWWVPNSTVDESKPTFLSRAVEVLKTLNMILLPFTIGLCVGLHIYYTIMTLVYVEGRPVGRTSLPANTKKNWLTRLMLVSGIAMSMSFGYGAFQIWDSMDLVHVKPFEYMVIVIPFQINFGLMMGSLMQWKIEKRTERMRLAAVADKAEEEAVVLEEKRPLIET